MFLLLIIPLVSSTFRVTKFDSATVSLGCKIVKAIIFLLNEGHSPDSILLSFRGLTDFITEKQFEKAPLKERFETYTDSIESIVKDEAELFLVQSIKYYRHTSQSSPGVEHFGIGSSLKNPTNI